MSIGAPVGKTQKDKQIYEVAAWRQVPAGAWLGTLVWCADGYQRRVRGELVWRRAYRAWGSMEDGGPLWTYAYAIDEKAFDVATRKRYAQDWRGWEAEEW